MVREDYIVNIVTYLAWFGEGVWSQWQNVRSQEDGLLGRREDLRTHCYGRMV